MKVVIWNHNTFIRTNGEVSWLYQQGTWDRTLPIDDSIQINCHNSSRSIEDEGSVNPSIQLNSGSSLDIVEIESEIESCITNIDMQTEIGRLWWTETNNTEISRIGISSGVDPSLNSKTNVSKRNIRCKDSLLSWFVEKGCLSENARNERR